MKVALVTGASRGLGVAMAKGLGRAGWAVAVNYAHDMARATDVVQQIEAAGGRAFAARFDVTEATDIQRGLADIAAQLGPVDLIVNNATGPQPMMPIAEQSWDDHLNQLRFFVKAPLLLLQAVLPDWRTRRCGRVINIGSEVVDLGNPCFGHYVAPRCGTGGIRRLPPPRSA
jgi:3-oxoacyl-[acyl-carrier protein] reductase